MASSGTTRSCARLLLPLSLVLLLFSFCLGQRDQLCDDPVAECETDKNYFPDQPTIDYANATIADLTYSNYYVDFGVVDPSSPQEHRYRLVKCGCQPPKDTPDNTQVLFTKPSRVHVSETPTLSLLDVVLVDLDWLAYIGRVEFIYNDDAVKRVKDGSAKEIRAENWADLRTNEKLSLSIIGNFDISTYEKAKTEKPFLVIRESNEANPLARAEWMKILGLLFEEAGTADARFKTIVERYNAVKEKAKNARRRPSVFFNYPSTVLEGYDENRPADENFQWSQPSRKQYVTALIRDANAEYRFDDGESAETMSMTFSQIEGNFTSANFLVHAAPSRFTVDSTRNLMANDTLDEFVTVLNPTDESLKILTGKLAAARCGRVWSHGKRLREGASDFFESAVFRPDDYLEELVHIFHPYLGLKDDDKLTWSYNIREGSQDIVSDCPFTDLSADARDGTEYVDHEFKVSGLTRFEIEDMSETDILPKLRGAVGIGELSMELFFKRAKDSDDQDTRFTVRLAVNEGTAEDFEDTESMLKALKESMNDSVSLVTGEETDEASGDGGGSGDGGSGDDGDKNVDSGIGGGAIAAIVISVIVLVLVAVVCAMRSRRRKRGGMGVFAADDNWAEGGGIGRPDEGIPMASA